MAQSTTQPNQQPTVPESAYSQVRTLHRAILAACVVLAPLLLVLGFALDPTGGTPHRDATTIAALALLKRSDEEASARVSEEQAPTS